MGKSYLVRSFAKTQFDHLLEINFERQRDVASIFESKDPTNICRLLEARFGIPLTPGQSLLFLDEIQAAPDVFSVLRYFREELPELHIIAAGSLLEFVLKEHAFSMPVGRIEYLNLGPMLFEEFLVALGKNSLRDWLLQFTLSAPLPIEFHSELTRLIRQYLIIGGMPESVAAFVGNGSYQECEQIQESVLATYRDDFNKYAPREQLRRVEKLFARIPALVGKKFMFTHVDPEERARNMGDALRLLQLARVTTKVRQTHANGIPLGAEADERNFKILFLDVGLLCRATGLRISEFPQTDEALLVNRGAVCEQFVGQHLLHAAPPYIEPDLYYWARESSSSNAEVDYVSAIGDQIVPIEVKAGKTGTLKSLHVFLAEKKRHLGLRFNLDLPSLLDAKTSIATEPKVPFQLLSLPLYMVGQADRLCRLALNNK